MGANEPRGMASLDPRGMVGRIYVGDPLSLLCTKYLSLGLMVSMKKIFEAFPIISLWELMTPSPPLAPAPSPKEWPVWTPGA